MLIDELEHQNIEHRKSNKYRFFSIFIFIDFVYIAWWLELVFFSFSIVSSTIREVNWTRCGFLLCILKIKKKYWVLWISTRIRFKFALRVVWFFRERETWKMWIYLQFLVKYYSPFASTASSINSNYITDLLPKKQENRTKFSYRVIILSVFALSLYSHLLQYLHQQHQHQQ